MLTSQVLHAVFLICMQASFNTCGSATALTATPRLVSDEVLRVVARALLYRLTFSSMERAENGMFSETSAQDRRDAYRTIERVKGRTELVVWMIDQGWCGFERT